MADEESPQDLLSSESPFSRKISQNSALDASLGSGDLEPDDDDDDNSSTDEEDAAAVQDDILMAERTNQLMTDFRSYITEIQGTAAGAASNNGGSGNNDGNNNGEEANVDAEYGDSSPQGGGGGALMRSWGDTPKQKPYRDNPHITQGYGDIHDDVILSRSPYSTGHGSRVYSKKLKRCLVFTVITGTLLAIILGTVHSIHERNVQKNLPDWEGELKAMEEEESASATSSQSSNSVAQGTDGGSASSNSEGREPQHTEQMSHNPQIGEGLQTTTDKDAAYYADAQGLDESGGNSPSKLNGANVVTDNEAAATSTTTANDTDGPSYIEVANRYSPLWYDRESGWSGETYDMGLIFCAEKKDVVGGSMVPCPYEAYCPEGSGKEPYGGSKAEVGGWAPILNTPNDWVMIGYSLNHCKKYSEMFDDPPSWGQNGGNAENTMHIMCCRSMDGVASSDAGDGSTSTTVDDTTAPSSIVQVAASTTPKPTYERTPSPIPVPTPGFTEEDYNLASDEYSFAETYQPEWFDRNQGWSGQTWEAADTFCKSKMNARLCPYEVYCPTGPNHLPYGGVRPESVVWAPMIDSNNAWVSVSNQNTCVTYTVLNLINPSWGLTGNGNEEMTRHVMCCKDPSDVVLAVSDSTESPEESFVSESVDAITNDAAADDAGGESSVQPTPTTDENKEKLYQIVSKEFKPFAFSRDRGWTGQTYTSALMFCASQESKIPCPYEIVCPLGPGEMPITGIREGMYSPIINAQNGYVSLETCERLSPYPPIWGLTDEEIDAEDITGVVVCCDEAADRIKHVAVDILLDELQQTILDEFKPQWYGRGDGYLGESWEDAQIFCNRVAGMELCPVEVYCPNGNSPSNAKPLFPDREPFDSEQWAPYGYGEDNSYVLVGPTEENPTTTCLTHQQLYSKPPDWGTGSTELKQNVLCCHNPTNLQEEKIIHEEISPMWMDSSDGWAAWEAGSYEDASAFCQSKTMSLCPLRAYCPLGPSKPVISGHADVFYGEQWAPVLDGDNQWVMIGQKYDNPATTCLTHEQLEGRSPDWGTSSDNSESKQHIMCCHM